MLSPPLRRAFALSYAMRNRPTKELARVYFDALKRVLDDAPNVQTKGSRG